MERKRPGDISAEGLAIDAAVDALTVAVMKKQVSKVNADRVIEQLMESPVGKVAVKENKEAIHRFIIEHNLK